MTQKTKKSWPKEGKSNIPEMKLHCRPETQYGMKALQVLFPSAAYPGKLG
jgi:hypothetical protein